MKFKDSSQLTIPIMEEMPKFNSVVILNQEKLIEVLEEIEKIDNVILVKNRILALKAIINNYNNDREGLLNIDSNGETISLRKDILFSELNQILESQTLERAQYYLKRLKNGIKEEKTSKINDINLHRWKEYDDILTDSLWLFDKRNTSGAHLGWYWGNFIPQIPHQMMLRYTKKDDWVLDTFLGSGTTLIESKRLGRNGIGIELNAEVANKAEKLIQMEANKYDVISNVIIGDSRTIDLKPTLQKYNINKFQLLIMHPPYHDIIRFSKDDKNDLSNTETTEEFLEMFKAVVNNVTSYLEKGRYLVLVIGDKYSKGEWIPLGFYCMQEVLNSGYLLKSIIVKNFEETRAKRNQQELWRYRALVGGFYVFKHEYIMLFKKK
ncbi:MAG TPA: DNA methyltransferase [Candidatus Cloacimonas acidaminovorans]|jgi:DNA modification methylase|nr:DNA methyltransferase [Candidatus Cloacimonas acidaminovorans]HRS60148.1 DNA methyltransferase [Candidatus Cloacimonas sp.]MDD5408014.1 DNA methyltransferase [Candidatus Cloacimonas acidaminovorans]HOE55645.1 DNA methyltransferase [Candidatus Cloacimonas acidaminovorans]HOM78717.1 DNA methyltransferase [Candidatus Cloacimonas acidaminovorans]